MNEESPVEPPSSTRLEFSWKLIPLLGLTALIVYLLVDYLAEAGELWEALVNVRLPWLAAAFASLCVLFAAVSLRFRAVIRSLGYEITPYESFDAIISTFPFAILTPSRASDLLRAVVLRGKVPVLECSGGVVAERLVDVQVLCLLATIGCGVSGYYQWMVLPLGLLLGLWIGIFIVIRFTEQLVSLPLLNRFDEKIRRLLGALNALLAKPSTFAVVFLFSIIAWIANTSMVYFLARTFGSNLAVTEVLAFWPLAIFVGMLPITLGGVGTRDAAFVFLMKSTQNDVTEPAILLATLGYSVLGFILPGIVGIPFMLRHAAMRPASAEDETDH